MININIPQKKSKFNVKKFFFKKKLIEIKKKSKELKYTINDCKINSQYKSVLQESCR